MTGSYRVGVAAAAAGSIPGCSARIPARHRLSPSIADRVAVLQGVLDTAARPGSPGQIILTTSSAALAGDVVEIVEGLGGTARTAPAQKEQHRLQLALPATINPFRDPLKATGYQPTSALAMMMLGVG